MQLKSSKYIAIIAYFSVQKGKIIISLLELFKESPFAIRKWIRRKANETNGLKIQMKHQNPGEKILIQFTCLT